MAALWPQFVLLGDSLIQDAAYTRNGFCFQSALQKRVIRRLDVVNRGLCGYNTSQVLRALPKIIPRRRFRNGPKIKYLVILFGANDACIKGRQHTDEDKYRANLKAMINHRNIRAHKPKIFVVTPPPVDDISHTQWEQKKGREVLRNAETSKRYSDIAREVAAEAAQENPNVILIDLYKALKGREINGRLDHLLPDGLHMNGEANEIFYDLVATHVESWNEKDREGYILPDFEVAPLKAAGPWTMASSLLSRIRCKRIMWTASCGVQPRRMRVT